ncbi:MAG: T9SS type A sorting domain-containing protein [bacterium]
MKKFVLFFLLSISINAQTTLQTVNFETAGSGYTITGEIVPASSACWARTDGTVISPDDAFTNKQGTYYFYGENTDSPLNNQAPVYVTLNSIDASLYTDFSIKLLVAGNNDIFSGYEGGEYLRIQYAFNGGSFTTLAQYIPSAIDIKYLTEDANADGTVDGANLSPAFTEFTYNIPGTGNSLQIRIMANIDQGGEEVGFDNIRVIGGALLPVELTSFTASSTNNNVQLNWQTATEVNNYGFEIERSTNLQGLPGENNTANLGGFSSIGFVEGHGNSNSTKEYSFVDKDVLDGSYLYRLKQIDTDGSFTYSKEITVKTRPGGSLPNEFALYQNYPNPFNPTTTIKYSIPAVETPYMASLRVYDVLGNEVAVLVNETKEPGVYEVEFNASGLSSGIYFYKIVHGNYSDIRKMILLR